jgi:hypothetical protein
LAAIENTYVFLYTWVIAIAYLIPTDLSFSVWAFWLIRVLLCMGAIALGEDARVTEGWENSDFPAPNYQSLGAALALLVWWIWRARGHLRHACHAALGREAGRQEGAQPLPYRLALAGLVVSTAGLVTFCWMSGTQLLFGLVLVLLIIASHVVWARLGAETGLAFMCWPVSPTQTVAGLVGTGALRQADVMAASTLSWASAGGQGNTFQVFASRTLEALKVADSARINSRRLIAAVVVALVFALALGLFVVLTGFYNHGYIKTALGEQSQATVSRRAGDAILWVFAEHEGGPDWKAMGAISLGAVTAVGLSILQLRFWWWPLHPVGFVAAFTWAHTLWIPFLLGWLGKALIIRYGGLALYRKTVPFAVGLIVGDLANKMLWAVVTLAAGGHL